MKIMISSCLLGENCKYNGGNNYNEKVQKVIEGNEVISVCPEVLGGLSTPRKPAEIVNGGVSTQDGRSVDSEFRAGAEKALQIAIVEKIDYAILQSRSPSCGSKQIYDGTFTGKKITGMGVFAEKMLKHGFKVIDVEDL